MRTTLQPALRSMLIFSAELVLGPAMHSVNNLSFHYYSVPFLVVRTDRADDARTAEDLRRGVLGVEVGDPFGAGATIVLVLVGFAHGARHAGQTVVRTGVLVVTALLFASRSIEAISGQRSAGGAAPSSKL